MHVACEDVKIRGREREGEGDVMRKHTCRKERERETERERRLNGEDMERVDYKMYRSEGKKEREKSWVLDRDRRTDVASRERKRDDDLRSCCAFEMYVCVHVNWRGLKMN